MARAARLLAVVALMGAAAAAWTLARGRARDVEAPATAPGRPRIVALVSGVVDTLQALDSLDCVVAMGHQSGNDPYDPTKRMTRILSDERGGMTNPEGVLSLRPDYVFAAPELVPSLSGRGLNVVAVPQDAFDEVAPFTLSLGRIVGKEDDARALLAAMDAKAQDIRRRVAGKPRVRVYWEDGSPGRTRGPGTAVHAMIELAGGANVYGDDRIARPTISLEALLAADPEVIVLNEGMATPSEVAARPGWDRMSAVRNKRVFVISYADRPVTLFTPRCVACCERTFLRWFHPELFEEGGR